MRSRSLQIILALLLLSSGLSAQCDPDGVLLELQSTTGISGLLRGDGGCVVGATFGSGISMTAGVINVNDVSATNEIQRVDTFAVVSGVLRISLLNDGVPFSSVTLPTADGSETKVNGSTGISVTGLGTIASPYVITNTAPDQTVSLTGGGISVVTGTYPNFTVTSTEVDGSPTNELQTLTLTSQTLAISGGNNVTLPVIAVAAGTGISVSPSGGTYTVTNTGDLSSTNEGTLGVSAGTSTTAVLTSNTSGATGVTFTAGTGIAITETTGTNGGNITISSTLSGTPWLVDGNTLTAAAAIGSNSNHSVAIETNGVNRMWVANTGQVTIGSTALTTYALNINGLQGGGGLFIDGGSGLTGPTYASFRGSGSGSTAYVADYQLNMLSGNVLAYIANTATSGTGSTVMSLNVNSTVSGDPVYYAGVSGGTGWYFGADNSATGDPFRITPGSSLGAIATGVSILPTGFTGINTLTPTVEMDVFGTGAVGIPNGSVAQRPTLSARPLIRYNNAFGGFELGDHNKNAWFRATALGVPTSVTAGGAAGSGATVNFTAGAGSNDCSGSVDLTTGTGTATGTVFTVTYNTAYSGTGTLVILDAGNDVATTQRARFSCQASSNTTFSVRAVTALDASTTYRIKYYVRNY